jgi:hypothetical protein
VKTEVLKKDPPESVPPGGVKGINQSVEAVGPQRSADIYDSPEWVIEPESRDGLTISVSAKDFVLLKQTPNFATEQEIRLHPDEARQLLGTLPEAIDEAEFARHGGPTFE